MPAPLIEFPRSLLRESEVTWDIAGSFVTGGQTGGGIVPVTSTSGGGFVVAKLSNFLLKTLDDVRAWNAFAAIAGDGTQPVIVFRTDSVQPWPAGAEHSSQVPFEDGVVFSDGSALDQDVIDIKTHGVSALRTTSLTLDLISASSLRGGESFSINHTTHKHKIYHVKTVTIDGNGRSVVTIRPPLREEVPDATSLEFDFPRCVMTAVPGSLDMRLSQLPMFKSASFIEAMPPYPE